MGLYFNRRKAFREVAPTYAASTANPNGSSMYFDLGDMFDAGTSDISLLFSFKTTGSGEALVSKQNDADANWWLCNINSGKIRMDLRVDVSNYRVVETTAATFADGNWHTVIIFVDRSAGTIAFNIDGSSEATSSVSSSGSITGSQGNTADFMVGRRDSTSPQYLSGSIGMVGVAFAADLTANSAELSGNPPCWDDMTSGLQSKFTSNGGELWHLAEFTGHTTDELTGQANENTITNNASTPFDGTGLTVACT